MRKILKQVLGIDVAQKELATCVGIMYEDWEVELRTHKTFGNTEKGFAAMLVWLKRFTVNNVPTRFVMEATGVYHESVAYFLEEKGYPVSIVLPNKYVTTSGPLIANHLLTKQPLKPLLCLV